jgi:hypothetical protein
MLGIAFISNHTVGALHESPLRDQSSAPSSTIKETSLANELQGQNIAPLVAPKGTEQVEVALHKKSAFWTESVETFSQHKQHALE